MNMNRFFTCLIISSSLFIQQDLQALPPIRNIIKYVKNHPNLQETLTWGAAASILGLIFYINKILKQGETKPLKDSQSEQDKNLPKLPLILLSNPVYRNDKKYVEKFIQTAPNILAYINQFDVNGDTPLIIAVRNGHEDITKILISAGADVNIKNKDGVTPLICAATNGYINILQHLIYSGAHVNETLDSSTALAAAVFNDHADCVKELIVHGADVNIDINNCSPLDVAILKKNVNILQILIGAGANVNAKNKDGVTPIMRTHHISTIKILLSAGAIVDDMTFLRSMDNESTDVLKEFLPFININKKLHAGCTFLSMAIDSGYTNIIKILIDAGADINAKTDVGFTILKQASMSGNVPAVAILLKAGVDIDAGITEGYTALSGAIEMGQTEVAKLLISAGANINTKTNGDFTVLMLASLRGRLGIVQKLIAAGADVNAKNKDGLTALTFARVRAYTKIQKILLDAGAQEE